MIIDQWLYTKDELLDTPSIADGITFEQEQMDRTKGCHYLLAVAARLNLPQLVVVTAATFFHRFFMRQSMKRFHIYDMAATSLFVATKVEESTRRIKDFVNACAQKASKNDKLILDEDSKDFIKWKDTMLCNEVILLETLCFDLSIQHPHTCLLAMETQLNIPGSMLRKAWMLLYQCCGSPLCVLYQPNIVAGAALLLASHLSSEPLEENWWELANLDGSMIHELASDMLGYYLDHYIKKSSSSSSSSSSSFLSSSPRPIHSNNHHHTNISPS
ncbi:cyclin-like protein [Halteromyces radiatus]|uniref:cyclin-like protein n=1 Tax=Halteromyces radiatus TaxID=101107 RepID=UPI00221EFD28|nr:cyclin-like protein [Halteromyces radiatus]KAI8098943.1 cyclin-like protein [Halteromyces radiatus]